VRIREELKAELAQRLEAAGYVDAAETLRTKSKFPDGSKPAVLGVLYDWLEEAESEWLTDELAELRLELNADVSEGR
jgi:hypothetical protein